jgi:hypothetical protein
MGKFRGIFGPGLLIRSLRETVTGRCSRKLKLEANQKLRTNMHVDVVILHAIDDWESQGS